MNKGLLIAIGAGIGLWLLTKNQKTADDKRAELASWAQVNGEFSLIPILQTMSDTEISDVYQLIFKYEATGTLVTNLALKNRLIAISQKYNIFT